MTAIDTPSPTADVELPHPIRLGIKQAALETKVLFRSKDLLALTLGLPLIFLFIFRVAYTGNLEGLDVSVGQWFTPGIIAASVLSAGVVNMATTMAVERHDGTLKRLALTPLPASSYLIGKVLFTLYTAAGMTVVLLGVGTALFDVSIPSDPGPWVTFTWVFLAGVISAAVLGIAVSAVPRTAKSAGPLFNLAFVFLMFISGVFIELKALPPWLQTFAGVFPLRWLGAGMRSVFLPEEYEQIAAPGGSYQLGWGALVLSLWVVVGFAVAVRTFRWGRER